MNARHSSRVRLTGRGWAVVAILWIAVAWFINAAIPFFWWR